MLGICKESKEELDVSMLIFFARETRSHIRASQSIGSHVCPPVFFFIEFFSQILQATGLLRRFKAKTFIREEEEGDPPHLSLSLSLSLSIWHVL